MDLTVRILGDLRGVNAASWDGLVHGPSPFLKHGFLRALDRSGSIGGESGWDPHYLTAWVGDRLVGATAAFVKDHSYGEYIFDFHWARAAMRGGLEYYPKLVVAAPATPATGRRFLLGQGLDDAEREAVLSALVGGLRELADAKECQSIHVLFCMADEQRALAGLGFGARASFQFHWHDDGYESFDDFLGHLTSRKRKMIRKERRRARSGVDSIALVPGPEVTPQQVDAMDRFYRNTTFAHGGRAYLQPGFFHALVEEMPEHVLYLDATRDQEHVAGSLFLHTDEGLYGRYWGCEHSIDCLHFEAAYYLGIQYAIEHRIPLFEAGAQGEHKLLRGFMPSPTFSAHWIRHPGLDRGIREFLAAEARDVRRHMEYLSAFGPFREPDPGSGPDVDSGSPAEPQGAAPVAADEGSEAQAEAAAGED